ncbi:hypothetical protein SPRG_05479 [Saprolegnia parasitica CBS 223.65]|uniref:Uncharacterized protein n=1 Tax=Saprolegnia parasitica (strain CBS 223.65) TaxID=695850 RepID=A0A067CRS8_SAPPC|nr:hypothetical protein SPRG_05479 [Saprolegnia parasitica CBS 223.65]KDO29522.1 hypothetical protein SPRG_05479 [Saprolegnia parasitica CBS 223.65]|eukprot:XP_012199588.1 hypothetical protein SPRG_05479 [Saprolegnia parasitica CBS 223.65]
MSLMRFFQSKQAFDALQLAKSVRCSVFKSFPTTEPMRLVMQGQRWSWPGRDYTVTDSNGILVAEIQVQRFSFPNQRTLLNAARRPVALMKLDPYSFFNEQKVYEHSDDDVPLLTIKYRKHASFHQQECEVRNQGTGKTHLLVLQPANVLTRRSVLTDGDDGPILAKVHQPFTCQFANRYEMDVAAGVDAGVVTLMCAAMDEETRKRADWISRGVLGASFLGLTLLTMV